MWATHTQGRRNQDAKGASRNQGAKGANIPPDFSNQSKFGFAEKATKFEENLGHTVDKSFVFCARNSVLLVKKSMKIFQNIYGQVVLYKL